MGRRMPQYYKIEYEIDGNRHRGWYYVEDGLITVSTEFGRKCTQLGGMRAEALARMLLRELIREQDGHPGRWPTPSPTHS
jgi:hypothetical protein